MKNISRFRYAEKSLFQICIWKRERRKKQPPALWVLLLGDPHFPLPGNTDQILTTRQVFRLTEQNAPDPFWADFLTVMTVASDLHRNFPVDQPAVSADPMGRVWNFLCDSILPHFSQNSKYFFEKCSGSSKDQNLITFGAAVKEAIVAFPAVSAKISVLPSPAWYMALSSG